jgi:hypothetical protein
MHEALDWLVTLEEKPSDERARQIVLCWLRSGLSRRDFCKAKGLWPNTLRHWIDVYCSAVAGRLTRACVPALPVPRIFRSRDIVFGVENIAAALGKTTKKTQSLIDAGSLPVGRIGGRWCASVKLLRPYRARKARVVNDNAERAEERAAAA